MHLQTRLTHHLDDLHHQLVRDLIGLRLETLVTRQRVLASW